MKDSRRIIAVSLVALAAVLVLAAAGIVVHKLATQRSIIPHDISGQVSSVILVPQSEDITISRSSIKYNPTEKVLSYTAAYEGTVLVVSEQPTPEQFTDIPQAYDKVISQMNNYFSFDTGVGTVHLTKPTNLHGGQTAVLNTKGTLLFAKPEANLTNDQWRLFFTRLKVVDS